MDDSRNFGPECAVLTSIGTLYLYRLTSADARALRDQPATRLAVDKMRHLLARVASTSVSNKGILDAGTITFDQAESLADDEVERVAEAYLESTSLRWYRQEGLSATIAVARNAGEPATKFLDRLVNWYAASRAQRPNEEGALTIPPRARARPAPAAVTLPRRDAWIALAALALVALLGIGAFLQHYLLVNALQRQVDALAAQVRQSNALLTDAAARAGTQNADILRRLDSLEAGLHAQQQRAAAARTHEAAAVKSPPAPEHRSSASKKTKRIAR
jgi:hypothetical protein